VGFIDRSIAIDRVAGDRSIDLTTKQY
jgi:hypothetical protein